jgi:hypothetical protein
MGWISPTGYSDPSSGWNNETYAYDENTDYGAKTTSMVGPHSWAPTLILTIDAIQSSKIRIYGSIGVAYPSIVKISVYNDGTWVEVYNGFPNDYGWQEASFTQGSVTQAKIEIYNDTGDVDYATVYEFDFWQVVPTKYSCSGPPDYVCSEDPDGIYNSLAECEAACVAPPPIVEEIEETYVERFGLNL